LVMDAWNGPARCCKHSAGPDRLVAAKMRWVKRREAAVDHR
jgi:hypothetical protein